MNRPVFASDPSGYWDLWVALGSRVVVVLELGGWGAAEFAVKAAVVEPVDPGEGLQLEVFSVVPVTCRWMRSVL
jgi:hypothetical protein